MVDRGATGAFTAATQFVRPEDVAASFPCGSYVAAVVDAVSAFWDAGFTDIALLQIGGEHQESYLEAAQSVLLPALREASA